MKSSSERQKIWEMNTLIRTAYAGEIAGVVFENERRFDLVLRMDKDRVADQNTGG